jgi:hypothetical protein
MSICSSFVPGCIGFGSSFFGYYKILGIPVKLSNDSGHDVQRRIEATLAIGIINQEGGIHRIQWTACSGSDGQLRTDYATISPS